MLTLADIQTSQFQEASGFCTSSSDFKALVNDAVEELMHRGDWPGTIIPIRVCVRNGCVTWPRYVSQVRKINVCGGSAPVQNQWYQFMVHGRQRSSDWRWSSWNWRGSCGPEKQMLMQFRAPTYNDVYGNECYLRVYPDCVEDAGATVMVFGLDGYGQPLKTRNSDGTWSLGITITVPTITTDTPYGSSSTPVSRIDRVVKSETNCNLRLYAYDPTNDWMYDLAIYEPSETNPSYLRYQLDGRSEWNYQICSSSSTCLQTVIALVKLANLPIQVATDLVIIDNKRALLCAIRALKAEEAGNYAQSKIEWGAAIESLNRQLEDYSPEYQFAAQDNVLAGRQYSNRMF